MLKQVAADQSDEDRNRGGAQIVNKRLDTDGADLFDITHRNDTGQDRKQNDRDDYELEQIQENGSDGFDVAFGKLYVALHTQAGNDTQNKSDKDLCCERQFIFFVHRLCSIPE